MVASAIRMRTPSATFLSKGACSLRRPQASYKFTAAIQHQLPALSALSRFYASKSFPPHTIISMPALSPTMSAGNIGAWQKKAGDGLQPGDVLVEIETDKAQMDFEFQEEGVLAKVLKETGEKDVSVGAPIAVLVEEGTDVSAFESFSLEDAGEGAGGAPKEAEEAPKEAPKAAEPSTPQPSAGAYEPDTSGEKLQPSLDREAAISPAAKALALEKGVPVKALKGTGRGGQITKEDVEKYKPAASAAAAGPASEDIPLTSMRKTIASRLQQSWTQNPHFFVSTTLSVTKLLKLRQALNASADGKYKLSVNDFLIKACAAALLKVPQVNSSWVEENGQVVIRQHNTADISVAVATPVGLITPIVKNAQGLGLSSISNQVKDLGKRARDNKLKPEEFQGGTFTISNMGMNPAVERFTAVINPPQAGILAVGTTRKVAIPVETEEGTSVEWDDQIVVTGSFDHRVVDGAIGAEWIKELKKVHRAPDINHVYKDEGDSTASLIDVDGPHVQSVDSDFLQQEVKTTTQAERIEREEEEAEEVRESKKQKAKAKASRVRDNDTNPVFLGNAALLALVGAGLGFGAYRRHTQGKLSWELVGLWTGAVGAFGAIDYFASKTSQLAASLASLSRTIDDYSALSKRELIPEKQEKAFERVKNFRSELQDYRQHFDQLRKEREDAQSVTNRHELLGRRPHHTATPENPYAQPSVSHSSPFAPSSSRSGPGFGGSDYTRESHALREQSFLSNTSSQIDEYLDRGRAVLADLGQQREVLKGTQRRLYSVANTLGVSGETIRKVERRAKQDKWIFWAGVILFLLFCWAVLHLLR
ncbi:hypothetical protein BDV12DRAFT_188235 [Aspergillus spectabilis]